MTFKLNKNMLFILAILCLFLIIPCSFANELENDTLSGGDNVLSADDTTIYVTNDENNGDGSLEHPYNSISDAVSEFNSTKNSNIYIKNGKYKLNHEVEVNKDIIIIGESSKETVIDGNSQNSIFKITNNVKITLINLTFVNAKKTIYSSSTNSLTIDRCNFENNTNAIYHYDYFSTIEINIKNSNFTNNSDSALSSSLGNLLNITNCIFENNKASNQGGAIYLYNNFKDTYIYNSKFINNSAVKGSAISLSHAGNLYIENSEFIDNFAHTVTEESSVVYDIKSIGEATLTLNKNIFTNNQVDNIYTKDNVKVKYLDKNTKLTGEDVDKYFGDDFNYVVKLTDNDGNPLVGREIITTLTNNYNNTITTITNITNSEGIAIFSLKSQSAGKYSVLTKFNGDSDYDEISIPNKISIRTDDNYNIIFTPDYVHLTEGEGYTATGFIYDEYLVPIRLVDNAFTVDWYDAFGKHLIIEGGLYKVTDGNKIVFDINRCHLITRDDIYELTFTVSNIGSGILKVDLSKDLSNIDTNLDTIYVSKEGNDETGDGSLNKPLATIQTALSANRALGGGKTIFVGEGIYELSTFTILGDATIVGIKGKSILKQNTGNWGLFEIDNKNTVKFINLTFINGYATPIPESLIHITDDSVAYFDGCEFYNNSAYGGGAIAVSRGGNIYINNSYFHKNKAIFNTNVGGVIYVERGYLNIENSVFENNTACDGGVIFLGFESEADITSSSFINNTAIATTHTEGGGGAIFTRSNNLNIKNCSFIENYAELYAGAIYIDYGAVTILKSYFENNHVKYNGESKGSAIESAYNNYVNLTLNYSILVSDNDHPNNYLVLIHEVDEENHTVDLKYNFWKTTGLKANPGVADTVQIKVKIENEYIYTGDTVEFTIELINSNVENGTSPLTDYVHDLNLFLKPSIGEIENSEITVKNNKATFTYKAINVGEERILIGDLDLYATYKFDVQDGSDKIDLNPEISINTGKISEITISLKNDIQTNITIRINDEDYSVRVNDSKAILKVDTVPGEYNIKVIYNGNETYKGFVLNDLFNVERFSSSVNISNITTYFNGNLEVKLLDSDNNPIANEIIIININETEYTVKTNDDGISILELNLDSVGIYNVESIFNGNNNYAPSKANSKLTIEFSKLTLTEEKNVNITPVKGSFSFTLTDDNGNLIKNTEIIITFNNKDYKIKTDSNGIATLNLDNNFLETGSYDISAKVEKTKVYDETSTSGKLNIIKAIASIKVENTSVYANTGNITVILVDSDENPINNTKLIITINNDEEIITDENGIATLSINLIPGNYTVTVRLAENNIYTAASANANINVKETITNINAPDITVYYTNGKFQATLFDVSGKPIENARLIININNNNYIATTNKNGTGSININNLPLGVYKAIITFEGNELFQASTKTSNINVISSIISEDIKKAYNSNYDFIALLKDSNGNPIANTIVNLMVNGKLYNVKSDINGIVRLTEKLTPNTYAITITNPITGEKTSNYAQIVSRFSEAKDIKMDYNDGTRYKVRVLNNDGNPTSAGEIVTFKINGKTFNVKTDSKGYASLKITNTPKTYTITASYKGETIKNIVTVKQILKANKKNIIVKKSSKKLVIKATLKHSNGKSIKNKKITFKVNGKKYTAKTNKKGIAKITIKKNAIKKLKKGKKYPVSITYLKDTVKCYVKVKK